MTAYAQTAAVALPRYPFGQIHAIAAVAYTDGDIVLLSDGRIGVVSGQEAIAINDPVCFLTTGVIEIASASGTVLAVGVNAYFDPTAKQVVTTAGGTNGAYYAGKVAKAKASGTTSVLVDINVAGSGGGAFDSTAPAGTNLATAAQIVGSIYWPASAGVDGTKGAKLPAPAAGVLVRVVNDHASNALKIYSPTGNIDGTIGTTASSVAAGKTQVYVSDGTNYRSQLGA